jgi:hypothetical protein
MVTSLPSEAVAQHPTSSTKQNEKGNRERQAGSGLLRLASRASATEQMGVLLQMHQWSDQRLPGAAMVCVIDLMLHPYPWHYDCGL